jgi:hypothetical protein
VIDAASGRVSFGSGAEITAASLSATPAYRADRHSPEDVGIVLVTQDLPRSPVPILTSRDARAGEQAIIAGWGFDQNKAGGQLRAATTTVTAVNDFLETSFASSAGQVCQGDSGGALLLQEGGVWSLAGVINGGSTSACNSGTSFYAIVRNPEVSAFIVNLAPTVTRR